MASKNRKPRFSSLAELADTFQSQGRYTFDREEALATLGVSSGAFTKALMRLAGKRRIVVPKKGFYVIVPLEYRIIGAPPASWFVDNLMEHLELPYYVGVLSAAALHGAGHQQPQEFQVVTGCPVRPATVGKTRLRFFSKYHIARTVVAEMKTETGTMKVSTPEATALDLLRYQSAIGGMGSVATVLSELAERMNGQELVAAAKLDAEMAYAQRLGYVLEFLGESTRIGPLARWIKAQRPAVTPLRPGKGTRGSKVNPRWQVSVNEEIEVDV